MSFSIAIRKQNAVSGSEGYRRGDIVQALPFDHPYTQGDKAMHWVVRITTPRTLAEVLELMREELDELGNISRRRLWRVLVDNVPATIRQEMQDNGEVTVSLAAIRNYIENKTSGSTY